MPVKIAILGGGSVFVCGILRTLLDRHGEIPGATVVLQDINGRRADLMRDLGRNLARARGVDLAVESTLDLDAALDGADFVLTCFRIGGFDALKLDEDIPIRHGVYANEMEGIGGLFLAQRTVPVVADIARRMGRRCPDAWMVNYANPTALVADTVRRVSSIREISICDGFRGGVGIVARFLEKDPSEITVHTVGVNHCTWLLRAFHRGREVTDAFYAALDAVETEGLDWRGRRVHEVARLTGYWPVPAGHMLQYFFLDEILEIQRREPYHSVYASLADQRALMRHIEDLARAEKPEFDMSLPNIGHYVGSVSDMAAAVILAIARNAREEWVLNYANNGAVANLPKGAIVEGPCVVGAAGGEPVAVGDLPRHLLPLIEALIESRRLAVDAALEGDRRTLLQAVQLDPTITDVRRAEALVDEMLAAQARWLPQYARALR